MPAEESQESNPLSGTAVKTLPDIICLAAMVYVHFPLSLRNVEDLLHERFVDAYERFREGKNENGERNRFLDNIRILGGKAARQHLILLLAGRHLSPALFDRLAAEVESLFFCYVITREPTRDFERNFAKMGDGTSVNQDPRGA